VTDPVPGLGGDSFFTLIETPRMHNSGALWFVADATDGSGESSAFSGLWRADPGATPAPLVSYADVLVSGEAVTLREILSYRVNRVGDVLMAARTSTSAIAWIYKRGSQ